MVGVILTCGIGLFYDETVWTGQTGEHDERAEEAEVKTEANIRTKARNARAFVVAFKSCDLMFRRNA